MFVCHFALVFHIKIQFFVCLFVGVVWQKVKKFKMYGHLCNPLYTIYSLQQKYIFSVSDWSLIACFVLLETVHSKNVTRCAFNNIVDKN